MLRNDHTSRMLDLLSPATAPTACSWDNDIRSCLGKHFPDLLKLVERLEDQICHFRQSRSRKRNSLLARKLRWECLRTVSKDQATSCDDNDQLNGIEGLPGLNQQYPLPRVRAAKHPAAAQKTMRSDIDVSPPPNPDPAVVGAKICPAMTPGLGAREDASQ